MQLTDKEFQVLRNKGTEPARSGEYDKLYPKEGYFACKGCGNPLVRTGFNSARALAIGEAVLKHYTMRGLNTCMDSFVKASAVSS